MNYRALGTWVESGYVVQEDRPVAIKRVEWRAAVTCLRTGQAMDLEYGATATVKVRALENYEEVAATERQALAILHTMIDEAVQGRGYIRKVNLAECLLAIQSRMIEGWVEAGGFTDGWKGELEASISTANAKYREIIEACRAIGAQPSPDHDDWGWVVAIDPLAVPRAALLVMPGAV